MQHGSPFLVNVHSLAHNFLIHVLMLIVAFSTSMEW